MLARIQLYRSHAFFLAAMKRQKETKKTRTGEIISFIAYVLKMLDRKYATQSRISKAMETILRPFTMVSPGANIIYIIYDFGESGKKHTPRFAPFLSVL